IRIRSLPLHASSASALPVRALDSIVTRSSGAVCLRAQLASSNLARRGLPDEWSDMHQLVDASVVTSCNLSWNTYCSSFDLPGQKVLGSGSSDRRSGHLVAHPVPLALL